MGLGDLGRREQYLARQLRRWRTQWERTKTRELAVMEDVADALEAAMPDQAGAAIVHGDYRLGNLVTTPGGRVAAVLDWELCTLGDPLADVGYILNNWTEPGERSPGTMATAPTACGGFPSRAEFVDEYARRSGLDVAQLPYYRAFQYWRLAAISEGGLARYLAGAMGDHADTDRIAASVERLAERAAETLAST
ncbi:MAG: phosphotransferase family protein [Acidimicrobiia bacterium]|nr:phosphotransferase family protein [Acidimicrobiia bacterium]